MKRSRGRGRRQQNPVNRSYDSNGPDVRVRGTASQVYEKYQTLARDAMSAGDRVMAENYQQHAEHYYRILLSIQPPPAEADSNGTANGDADAEANDALNGDGNGEPLVLTRGEDEGNKPKASRRRGPLGKKANGNGSGNANGKGKADAGAEAEAAATGETEAVAELTVEAGVDTAESEKTEAAAAD